MTNDMHTPEPWEIDNMKCIVGNNDTELVTGLGAMRKQADARRIVACVNACKGLPTKELEESGLACAFGTQMLALEQQRDELRDSIKKALCLIGDLRSSTAELVLRDAIAKEGETAPANAGFVPSAAEIHEIEEAAKAIAKAGDAMQETPSLAKYQKCGCVVCTCEDDEQCQGCGSHHCGAHPEGDIPDPVFDDIAKARGDV